MKSFAHVARAWTDPWARGYPRFALRTCRQEYRILTDARLADRALLTALFFHFDDKIVCNRKDAGNSVGSDVN